MTASTAERNKHHKGEGFIPADWKSHVGKTLITLALTGLGSLTFLTARFLLNAVPRLRANTSKWEAIANEQSAQAKRTLEFSTALQEINQRRRERFDRATTYVESNKNHVNLQALSELAKETSEEAARDAGLLSGYTPETTGLPVSFHDSIRGFSEEELDFWRSFKEAADAIPKNPKNANDKLLELNNRLPKMIYAISQFVSSAHETTEVLEARAHKATEFAQTIKAQADDEIQLISLAWHVLLLSALSFLLLACLAVLTWLQGKAIKKG